MKKFFVLFCIPVASMKDWMANTDDATKKQQMDEMMASWNQWMEEHKDSILDKGFPLGKTKRVTAGGIADAQNDLNYYVMAQAETAEAAAELFKDHPHAKMIPSAYIDIVDASRAGT